MSVVNSYYFTVSAMLLIGSKSYNIEEHYIRTIILDYSYDKMNMPIIYLKLRIPSELYNIMVLNVQSATISFRLFKSEHEGVGVLREPYIEDRFTYIMTTDPNYNESFEQLIDKDDSDTDQSSYMEGYIGLTSIQIINDNKKLFNDIVKDTNPISIIHRYTKHMNMVIEPLDNNDHIDQFIIPPITSITNLIDYINRNYCLYKSGYRFFRDFGKSYLLSATGKAVPDEYSSFNTIIVVITDPLDNLSKMNSMEIDKENHAYIIYINAKDTNLKVDRVRDKQYNSILGVDTLGNSIQETLAIPTYPESTKKVILERTVLNNVDRIYNTKAMMESVSVILNLSKTEIDSTILTPNKEYLVRNYEASSKYNGRYILSYKKEIIFREGTTMLGNVMFGLRRVKQE